MWSREGVPSAESVRLPVVAHSDAQADVTFSTLCVSAEGFWLKYANFCDDLSAVSVSCLGVLVTVTFLVLLKSLMRG